MKTYIQNPFSEQCKLNESNVTDHETIREW